MVDEKAREIIETTFHDAIKVLGLSSIQYDFSYEKMGVRFRSIDNAAEVDNENRNVYINEDWANHRVKEFEDDLYYIMAHEARHVYQEIIMGMYKSGQQTDEQDELVKSWINNKNNYIQNQGGSTVKPYYCQPLEVDADAFANFYMLAKEIGQPRFPKESDELVERRLNEIAAQYGYKLVSD